MSKGRATTYRWSCPHLSGLRPTSHAAPSIKDTSIDMGLRRLRAIGWERRSPWPAAASVRSRPLRLTPAPSHVLRALCFAKNTGCLAADKWGQVDAARNVIALRAGADVRFRCARSSAPLSTGVNGRHWRMMDVPARHSRAGPFHPGGPIQKMVATGRRALQGKKDRVVCPPRFPTWMCCSRGRPSAYE